jgi:hypothetical protein
VKMFNLALLLVITPSLSTLFRSSME